jgi:prepilin peptidase CpaA
MAAILVLAVVYDLRLQRIPNLLTYPAMAGALLYHAGKGGVDGLLFSAGGLALGVALLILPYLMGGMGAGDVKLLGAVGAMLGPKGVFISFVFTGLVGGVYALALVILKPEQCGGMIARSVTTLKTLAGTGQFIPIPAREAEHKPRLCYGMAIAFGTIIYVSLQVSGYRFPF